MATETISHLVDTGFVTLVLVGLLETVSIVELRQCSTFYNS